LQLENRREHSERAKRTKAATVRKEVMNSRERNEEVDSKGARWRAREHAKARRGKKEREEMRVL